MLISGRMLSVALVVLGFGVVPARADQKIVFMRHGEKPTGGYGQLTCQGLNRALALPPVLAAKYGKPNYLYAPNPAVKLTDSAGSFYYIRPLATSVFTDYAFAFEVASVLLLAAMVGAIVLTTRDERAEAARRRK